MGLVIQNMDSVSVTQGINYVSLGIIKVVFTSLHKYPVTAKAEIAMPVLKVIWDWTTQSFLFHLQPGRTSSLQRKKIVGLKTF